MHELEHITILLHIDVKSNTIFRLCHKINIFHISIKGKRFLMKLFTLKAIISIHDKDTVIKQF